MRKNCWQIIPLYVFMFVVLITLSATLYAQDTANKIDPPASSEKTKDSKAAEKPNPYANADITTKIIPSANNTFGYEILIYGRPLVHQPSIPGLPGNEGFTTKERAQKVADMVMKKIKNNEMPPTVMNVTSEQCKLEGKAPRALPVEGATRAPVIDELSNLGVLK